MARAVVVLASTLVLVVGAVPEVWVCCVIALIGRAAATAGGGAPILDTGSADGCASAA